MLLLFAVIFTISRRAHEKMMDLQRELELARDREITLHNQLSKAVLCVEKAASERDTFAKIVRIENMPMHVCGYPHDLSTKVFLYSESTAVYSILQCFGRSDLDYENRCIDGSALVLCVYCRPGLRSKLRRERCFVELRKKPLLGRGWRHTCWSRHQKCKQSWLSLGHNLNIFVQFTRARQGS